MAEELRHAVRRQRADRLPVVDALGEQTHAIRMIGRQHRVVGAELLDEAAIARAAAVGHHDVVVGTLLGASAREADLEAHKS